MDLSDRPYLLDASAVLAYAGDEIGGKDVGDIFHRSMITELNFAEVIRTALKLGVPNPERLKEEFEQAGLLIVPGKYDPVRVGELSALPPIEFQGDDRLTHRSTISLGDAVCLATGESFSRDIVVITSDLAWQELHRRGMLRVLVQLFR
ncbi:hypothetical protein ACFY3G_19160 [Streptomyces phaeochromogenes]|uniref:hypothetical protein n=1 Tax=Streptomyces phaeochromogenes TaxID=1923 RepID=UPI0036A03A24